MAVEIGSITLPHKVNSVEFDTSEGILGTSNAILHQVPWLEKIVKPAAKPGSKICIMMGNTFLI